MHHRHTPPLTSTIHEHTNDRPRAQALHQNGEDGLEAFLNKYQVTKHTCPHTYHSSALPPATRPNPGLSFTQYASQPPPTPCIYPYIYNAHGALLTQQAAEAIRICLLLYCGDGCRSMTTEKVRVNAIRSRRNQPICGHTHTHTHTHTHLHMPVRPLNVTAVRTARSSAIHPEQVEPSQQSHHARRRTRHPAHGHQPAHPRRHRARFRRLPLPPLRSVYACVLGGFPSLGRVSCRYIGGGIMWFYRVKRTYVMDEKITRNCIVVSSCRC